MDLSPDDLDAVARTSLSESRALSHGTMTMERNGARLLSRPRPLSFHEVAEHLAGGARRDDGRPLTPAEQEKADVFQLAAAIEERRSRMPQGVTS
jgi:hypothetical protein